MYGEVLVASQSGLPKSPDTLGALGTPVRWSFQFRNGLSNHDTSSGTIVAVKIRVQIQEARAEVIALPCRLNGSP